MNWNRERSTDTFSRTGHMPTLEACPCSRDRLYTHDGACSRLEQVVPLLNLDYKAVGVSPHLTKSILRFKQILKHFKGGGICKSDGSDPRNVPILG